MQEQAPPTLEQLKQRRVMLVEALLSAFRDWPPLEQMVFLQLGENLPAIVTYRTTLRDGVVQLVSWAERECRLATLVAGALAENPSNPELRALTKNGLREWAALDKLGAIPPPCPYPGMVPFKAEDTRFFFGREAEIDELLIRLRSEHFQFVIGPSGSGKSSLLVAGVLPRLNTSGYWPAGYWRVLQMRPGGAPNEELRQKLGGEPVASTADLLLKEAEAQRLLLVVDQFEELFAQATREEQITFIAAIEHLCEIEHCVVVPAMRADFYPDLMASRLWTRAEGRRLEVVPLLGARLREAIVKPAEAVGVELEPALIERLMADASDELGSLPMLQETLVLLWPKIARRTLAANTYAEMGHDGKNGLTVAIARKADSTFVALSKEQQVVARRILLRLVQFGEGRPDTRRRQPVAELGGEGADPQIFATTLAELIANRLLVLGGEVKAAGQQTADIAHETLIRNWPTLQTWIAERRAAEEARRRLENSAAEWERLSRKGGLLDEAELGEAERWLAHPDAQDVGYDSQLSELVRASRSALDIAARMAETEQQKELRQQRQIAEQQREIARHAEERRREAQRNVSRLRGVGVLLVLLLLVAAATTIFAVNQTTAAQSAEATAVAESDRAEEQTRVANSRALAAQAIVQTDQQLDLASLLAAEAYFVAATIEARDSLLTTLHHSPKLTSYLPGHTSDVSSVAFSPDGKTLASGSGEGTIILWDVAQRTAVGQPLTGHTSPIDSVAFSPDGKTLASSSGDGIILWDVTQPTAIGQPLSEYPFRASSVVFSPDGKTLAFVSYDSTIILWDLAQRTVMDRLSREGYSDNWTSVAFSPDGRTIASGNQYGSIILWDVAQGTAVDQRLTGHTSDVSSVAFSPDGKTLASGSWDNTIILWDVAQRTAVGQPLTGHTDNITSVAFNPDGKTLGSSSYDRTIILWDVQRQAPIGQPLAAHNSIVFSVAFSPDGKTLASGGVDNTIILWDVQRQAPIGQPLAAHSDRVNSVAFSPDGKTLASGSYDGTIFLWDVDAESWQARACRRANRNLSQAEWERYMGADKPYRPTCPGLPNGEGVEAATPRPAR